MSSSTSCQDLRISYIQTSFFQNLSLASRRCHGIQQALFEWGCGTCVRKVPECKTATESETELDTAQLSFVHSPEPRTSRSAANQS